MKESSSTFLRQPATVEIPGLGPVLFAPSRRARRLILSIRPFRGIRLAIPNGVSMERASAFLDAKRYWLLDHLPRVRRMEAALNHRADTLPAVDRQAATRILTARLHELARRHGFVYQRVTIRNQKSRWGSCSAKNNISLNMKLMLLPPELMDYVLLHELLHTRIKNHGPAFWDGLERLAGDARQKRARLKAYHLAVL
ncbi:MAG: M48 family metallopeptidase [Desulfobulbaceae bacterium]|nr:M48 family metallopeptidase [Desulfobulbaceae bacterium]